MIENKKRKTYFDKNGAQTGAYYVLIKFYVLQG